MPTARYGTAIQVSKRSGGGIRDRQSMSLPLQLMGTDRWNRRGATILKVLRLSWLRLPMRAGHSVTGVVISKAQKIRLLS